ncbi:hypothetical protein SAMN05720487_1071 [Fibrobacter sp. UWT2]|uniref:hypothetical protein n=1 Tax=Fibrobacter sp. UWT2 TaxID=1896224 RepID=UPI00092320F7|nr:hypothetical protein [Fibrobacter sp. UWT2]SHL01917.1 hypothetical protein SAMN05720487_1071 [Fibrobacter sp. UWT2]
MRLEQKINSKAGVSLIAVLLFMLVATIAATATYKWITSESRSSSSRMLEREAYQSAVAGIESARSWMTYHANDVGALIRQYKTSGNAAIKLNGMLTELVRPGQKFNVWLTGVTTENSTYKLKLVSEGEARNGQAKHTEVAILNVSGLYRVKLPTEHSGLNYEEAFQGRSTGITGSDSIQSAIINGDWITNNTPKIGNLVVTGEIRYGGAVTQSGNLYVGGDLRADGAYLFGRSGLDTNIVYVGGNIVCTGDLEVHGDVYIGGDVDQKCKINVSGNMTVGGTMTRTNDAQMFTIGKNLVFKDNAELNYSGEGAQNADGVGHSTYLSKISGPKSSSNNKRMNLGSPIYLYDDFDVTVKVCKQAATCSETGYCQGFYEACGSENVGDVNDRYFLFASTGNNVSASKVQSWHPTDDVLKDIGDNYWEKIDKMNAYGRMIDLSTGEVPQAIFLKDTAAWKQKLANDLCGIDPAFVMNDDAIDDLNDCYNTAAAAGQLYEGFLPIRWDYVRKGDIKTDKKLEHNFIIYVPRVMGQTDLPPTASNAVVLFYLGRGASNELQGATGKTYNYFVYSKGDIAQFNNVHISGSVMMEPGKTLKKYQGGVILDYNRSVMRTLVNAGLIEENPEFTALVNPTADPAAAAAAAASDDYYIAVAPQLSITVETQYANKEKISNLSSGTQEPEASFIVLPRIIYLPRTPKGSLDQYYRVIPLNSKAALDNSPNVNCNNQIPVGTSLTTSNQELEAGIYTCHVTGSILGRQSTVPFYVVVSGDASTPPVSFGEAWVDLRPDEETTVSLNVTATSGGPAGVYKVTVRRPASVTGWDIAMIPAANGTCTGNDCQFTINTAVGTTNIFTVKNVSATTGQLDFQITDCDGGCIIGTPYIESIKVASDVAVRRQSLESWCTANGDGSSDADKAKCAKKSAPDCSTNSEWIMANGVQCSRIDANDSWNCKNMGDISLKILDGYVPNGCEAVVPGDNLIPQASLAGVSEVTLYASLKAKQFTFSTGFATDEPINTSQKINISVIQPGATEPVTSNCSYGDFKNAERYAEKCQVQVYYGSVVTLSFPENSDKADFDYWMCESGTDCPSSKVPYPENTYTITITGNDIVHAHFNESDKHCFFDEFKDASYKDDDYRGTYKNRSSFICAETNPEKEYCLDATRSHPNAKWRLVSGDVDDIQFDGDGRISLKSSATRRSKEDAKKSVTIMSTVVAGGYGTLKAQFQVPREEVSLDDEAKATIKQSGFLLRAEEDATSYLMLNVFSDRLNRLKARICVNGENTCQTKNIGNAMVNQGDIILVAATLTKNNDNRDILVIKAYTDAFSVEYQAVAFELTQSELSGVQHLSDSYNQYVGYRLSDQNFKLYGIGWQSDEYSSECWDKFPSISCSFRAAYAGGLVPQNRDVKPWIGLSTWFGANKCTPDYYYNGNDAGCSGYVENSDDYKKCSSTGYNFSGEGSEGLHGNTVEVNGNIVDGNKTARVGVSGVGCEVYGEEAPWANSIAAVHCGTFWVGNYTNCTEHKYLTQTVDGAEGTYFGIDANGETANFRGANLIVTLDNPSGAEVTVYLFSQNSTSGYTYGADPIYSQPYTSTAAGTGVVLNISVDGVSNVDGFDPEKVVGVYVKYDDASGVGNISVNSRCPNALSLFGCRAEYNPQRDVWNVSATITAGTSSQVKSVDLTRVRAGSFETSLTGNTKNCSETPSPCAFSGDDFGWEIHLDHTPYNMGNGESIDYQFWIEMVDNTNHTVEGSPCITRTTTVPKISSSCRIASNSRSKRQGMGLPIMTYSIAGCPETSEGSPKCGYTIKVKQNGSDVATVATNSAVSGNVSNLTTDPDVANTQSEKLAVGTYRMVLESSNAEYPFTPCSQEFEITDERTPSGDLECSMNDLVLKNSNEYVYVTSRLDPQEYNIYIDDATSPAWTGNIRRGRNISVGPFTTPNDNASHTFIITKASDSEIQCMGTFSTTDAIVCSIENEVKAGESNTFVVEAMPGIDIYYCTYDGPLDCKAEGSTCPGTLSNQTFTLATETSTTFSVTCNTSLGNNISCSATASPASTAPVVTCPTTPIRAGHNETIVVSPISVENCEEKCSYWFETPNGTKKGQGVITTQTSVSFLGSADRTGENTYKFHVENGLGSDECDIVVNYAGPTYTCPDDMEVAVGADVTVEPTDVLHCPAVSWGWGWGGYTGGCSYTISGGSFTDVTGGAYRSGPIPQKIKGETAASTDDGTEYTLTLSSSLGDGEPCTFKVKYVVPPCGCTCDPFSLCYDLKTENIDGKSNATPKCIFAKDIHKINENYRKYPIYINGKRIASGFCTDLKNCETALRGAGITKVDNGYYILAPVADWIQITTGPIPHDFTVPNCSSD